MTGKLYNSLSGHGFMFDVYTCNVIGYCLKSKRCPECSTENSLNRPVEPHDCDINWEGASGGELLLILVYASIPMMTVGTTYIHHQLFQTKIAQCVTIFNTLQRVESYQTTFSLHNFLLTRVIASKL